MLLLMFQVADQHYAVDADRVVEVVPRVELRPIPHAPEFLVGLFGYRGTVVPVVDLGLLLGSEVCRSRLSTRIILVDVTGRSRARRSLLGLIAEHVYDVRTVRNGQVLTPPMPLEQSPYLGSIVQTEDGLAQLIDVGRVLSEPLWNGLYGDSPEAP
jgi:chemotaxis-related protein WspB